MRRSRGASGFSTPIANHNSNSNDSCSQLTTNATSYMTNTINSHFGAGHAAHHAHGGGGGPASNSVAVQIQHNEAKVRSLLKDLQGLVKKCQEARVQSEPNLTNITKAHEKMKKEEKLSISSRKKLRSMYATTLKESETEIKALRQVLDSINQVRLTQKEIRLLQTQQLNSSLTSPNTSFNASTSNIADTSDSKTVIHKKGPTVTMRRGVLMSILQQAALTLPLWVGDIGQSAPPLCGSIPPESNYTCKPGDKVAAIVKNSNINGADSRMDDDNEEEENWILAEVVAYHASTGKYDVDDVDAEEDQIRYTLSRKRVVPLPLWRANPLTDPDAIFPKDSFVLALYPQTTCFYRGIVSEAPQTPLEDYLILFEDNTYPEGYSPPLNVPQLYVVDCPEFKK